MAHFLSLLTMVTARCPELVGDARVGCGNGVSPHDGGPTAGATRPRPPARLGTRGGRE
ncbi:hypothetical protein Sgou_29420 [Streptomyces gougerotii]|uniref:Uncharacterized protein n=2 Tax=Streptomyces diastaticus group TaxID=2849069 RepID=A0A8H9HJK7_9ACTN|nr:hypothetical protein Srut_06410 [Streptomyces rutgersensis]GFH69726.1 hypothetical protein Sdia_04940 [Streptomyces diastaticus subsp. diastaticus]GFH78272.1 hypothetical protein Sgou_29420 [Streptomyces gougerotii]GGU69842.1 hypothetical protein GCM10010227_24640 [Streptomyces gougerotii]